MEQSRPGKETKPSRNQQKQQKRACCVAYKKNKSCGCHCKDGWPFSFLFSLFSFLFFSFLFFCFLSSLFSLLSSVFSFLFSFFFLFFSIYFIYLIFDFFFSSSLRYYGNERGRGSEQRYKSTTNPSHTHAHAARGAGSYEDDRADPG